MCEPGKHDYLPPVGAVVSRRNLSIFGYERIDWHQAFSFCRKCGKATYANTRWFNKTVADLEDDVE